jgi:LacI family transcriptional regulator
MNREQVTIKHIAKELGVSISTVSRALSNNPLVKQETKESIQKLAKEMNYHPNFTALSLRQRKTNTIGLLIPQVVHEFFAQVIRGIEDVAYSQGYNVLISSSNESFEREFRNAAELLNGRIDGLLACITKETKTFEHFQEYINRQVPLVFFDCVPDTINTDKVVIDDLDAGFKATEHLIQHGCKTLAFVGGPKDLNTNHERLLGFLEALKRYNLERNPELILHGNSGNFNEGFNLSKGLFNQRKQPDGVFATTDMLGIGVMKNAKAAGLAIPKDIAVIGFSNWEISEIFEPSLSTIDQRGYDIGKIASARLLERIDADQELSMTTEVIKTSLMPRASSMRKD